MSSLLIVGAGQLGKIAKEIAEASGFDKIDFLDDRASIAVGKMDEYEILANKYDCGFVAFGDCKLRMQWIDKLEAAGYNLTSLIHERAYVSSSASLGEGTILQPGAMVNSNTTVGKGCILSIGALVDHDVLVEDGCHIETGAVVMPNTKIDELTVVKENTVWK